jgi:hypothetical protein
MKTLLLALLAVAVAWGVDPYVVYTKSFPGSTPAFVSIELQRDGQCVYKEAADDEQPARFKIAAEEAQDIYALAAKLGHFSRPLESRRSVGWTARR